MLLKNNMVEKPQNPVILIRINKKHTVFLIHDSTYIIQCVMTFLPYKEVSGKNTSIYSYKCY